MNKWCKREISELIEMVASCKGPEEVCEIFDIVLTPREINDMARRYKIKRMLEEGQSYSEIRKKLGVGSDVIGRVSAHIGYGFRRSDARVLQSLLGASKRVNRKNAPRRKGIYYKGTPSPGTMLRNLKASANKRQSA